MPKASVVALYQKLTGGPDTSLNELDVLKYWSSGSASPIVHKSHHSVFAE
jgi:hypothetical protein